MTFTTVSTNHEVLILLGYFSRLINTNQLTHLKLSEELPKLITLGEGYCSRADFLSRIDSEAKLIFGTPLSLSQYNIFSCMNDSISDTIYHISEINLIVQYLNSTINIV